MIKISNYINENDQEDISDIDDETSNYELKVNSIDRKKYKYLLTKTN